MAKLNPANTAPKDSTMFLAQFKGAPSMAATMYYPPNKEFVYANPLQGLYKGKFQDNYFESEYVEEKELIGWLPMPEVDQ
tara:strand:- start:427 stop:666 length:240 start_codon:yes stop_codon:yes gene_type:complete